MRVTFELSPVQADKSRASADVAIQGSRARYKGSRKNTLDLRRVAVIANLQRIARLPKAS